MQPMRMQGIRDRFHSLALEDSGSELSLQELSKRMAADIAVRSTLNTNRLGHHRLEPLTPLLFTTLLTLLSLPTIMPPRQVHALFAGISAGTQSPAAIREALQAFTTPAAEHVCQHTSEDVRLLKLVLSGRTGLEADLAEEAGVDAEGQRLSSPGGLLGSRVSLGGAVGEDAGGGAADAGPARKGTAAWPCLACCGAVL